MPIKVQLCLLLIIVIGCCNSAAAAPNNSPTLAFQRAAVLARGININIRLQQTAYQAITDAELTEIKNLGFTHVRLPFLPELLVKDGSPTAISQAFVAHIADIVQRANQHQLAAVVDYHPKTDAKREGTPADLQTSLLAWQMLTKALNPLNPNLVIYELYNEPIGPNWQQHMEQLVKQTRALAPHNTLLVGGGNWNSIEGLTSLVPPKDNNIIYVFHYYAPMAFTHQGADWTTSFPGFKNLRGITYPVNPVKEAGFYANIMKDLALAKDFNTLKAVAEHATGQFTSQTIVQDFARAKAWGQQHNVPIVLNEFGVIYYYARPADRAQWLHDVRTAAEQAGFGWAMWEYDFGFGLKKEGLLGVKTVDPSVVAALGLTLPISPTNSQP